MAGSAGVRLDRLEWPSQMEEFFILQLLARLGLMRDIKLRQNDWEEIDAEMSSKYALRFSVNRLKEKYNRLKVVCKKFTNLLNQTGVKWDSATNNVDAPPHVWDKLGKYYRTFRKHGCPNYHHLQELFCIDTETGSLVHSPNVLPLASFKEWHTEKQLQIDVEEGTDYSDIPDDVHPANGEPRLSLGKRSKDKYVSSAEKKLGDNVDLVCESMKSKSKSTNSNHSSKRMKLVNSLQNVDPYSLEACLELLNEIKAEGHMTPQQYISIVAVFHSDHWRKAFMIMPDDFRHVWVANTPPPGQ